MTTTTKSMEQVFTESALAINKAIETHGPQTVELALSIGQIAAIQNLVFGFINLGVAYAFFLIGRKIFMIQKEQAPDSRGDISGFSISLLISGWLLYFFSGVLTLMALERVTTIINWVGIYKPEAYLAYKALGL